MEPRPAKVALTTPDQDAAELPVTAGSEPTTLVADLPGEGMTGGAWEVAYRVTSANGHPGPRDAVVHRAPSRKRCHRGPRRCPRVGGGNASSEPADGAASGGGKQTSDAREDDGAGSWRLVAPVLLGGFLLLLATLLLVTRFTRVTPVESIDGTPAETTTGRADAEAGHGVADTQTTPKQSRPTPRQTYQSPISQTPTMPSPTAPDDHAITGSPVIGGGTRRAAGLLLLTALAPGVALGLLFLSDGLAATSLPGLPTRGPSHGGACQ